MSDIARLILQLSKLSAQNIVDASTLLANVATVLSAYPESLPQLVDSISNSQLESKKWLVDELEGIPLGVVFLCGGWYATVLFDSRLDFTKCVSIDLDPSCRPIAKILHTELVIDDWTFIPVTKDIRTVDFHASTFEVIRANGTTCDVSMVPTTVINTSCEHIDDFTGWWDSLPKGILVAVQSNNGYDIPGHVNCSSSLVEFAATTPLATELYSGEKDMFKFTRYMRIGIK